MTDRSIVVRLKADVANFKAAMAAASKATTDAAQGVEGYVTKNKEHINQLSTQAGLVGVALVGVAALAVKHFADFDQAMSNVAATGDDARASIDKLRAASIEAGAKTVFSATEAAGAVENLAKAGVSAADILGGALTGSLNLAAAGAISVESAAEDTATALTIFGLKGTRATHVADLLAAGAGKAQGGVSDMAQALQQSGLVAHQTGLTLEETTGGLAAFASAGLIGSDAGTSFKTMLQRLTPQSDQAKQAMHDLGISAYDSQGNFIGLAKFAGNLHDSLVKLTPEARNAALATIFGSDSVRAASVLYNDGEKGIRKWIAAVDDQGYAAKTAATRMDNLKGDLEQLRGSLDTALIGSGSGANDGLRSLTQEVTNLVNAFATLPHGVQETLLALVGIGGVALLGATGIAKVGVAINDARLALKAMEIDGKAAGLAVGGIGLALGVATVALSIWADSSARAEARVSALRGSLDEATGSITKNSREIVANDLTARQGWWLFKKDSAASQAKILKIDLDTLTDAVLGNKDAIEKVNAATAKGSLTTQELHDKAKAAGIGILDYANAQRTVREEVGALSDANEKALKDQKDVNSAVNDGSVAQNGLAASTGAATVVQQAQARATQEASDALVKWMQATEDADGSFVDLQGAFDAVIQEQTALAQSSADNSKSSTDSWNDFYDGQSVSADQYIAQLQAQVDAQSAWETNMTDITARVNTTMTGDMRTAANGMIDELLQLGPKGAAQVQLLHDMSDTELAQVVTLYEQKGVAAASQFAQGIHDAQVPILPTPQISSQADAVSQFLGQQQARLNANPLSLIINTKATVGVSSVAALHAAGVPGFAGGGQITGPGSGTSDSVHAMVSTGEYVVKAAAVNQYGSKFFDNLNAQRFAGGGPVGVVSPGAAAGPAADWSGGVSLTNESVDRLAAAILAGSRNVSTSVLRASAGRAR